MYEVGGKLLMWLARLFMICVPCPKGLCNCHRVMKKGRYWCYWYSRHWYYPLANEWISCLNDWCLDGSHSNCTSDIFNSLWMSMSVWRCYFVYYYLTSPQKDLCLGGWCYDFGYFFFRTMKSAQTCWGGTVIYRWRLSPILKIFSTKELSYQYLYMFIIRYLDNDVSVLS